MAAHTQKQGACGASTASFRMVGIRVRGQNELPQGLAGRAEGEQLGLDASKHRFGRPV